MTIFLLPVEADVLLRVADNDKSALEELVVLVKQRALDLAKEVHRPEPELTIKASLIGSACTRCKKKSDTLLDWGVAHDENLHICLECSDDLDAVMEVFFAERRKHPHLDPLEDDRETVNMRVRRWHDDVP